MYSVDLMLSRAHSSFVFVHGHVFIESETVGANVPNKLHRRSRKITRSVISRFVFPRIDKDEIQRCAFLLINSSTSGKRRLHGPSGFAPPFERSTQRGFHTHTEKKNNTE